MSLRNGEFKEVYEANHGRLIEDFYTPALNLSTKYDRAVGYFRSTVFHLIGVALSDFVLREGMIRLVCSPSLSSEDAAVVARVGRTSEEQIVRGLEEDIQRCLTEVKEHANLQLLATLLKHELLDLRITYRPDHPGIFHSKVGILRDQAGNALSFGGSINETYFAWSQNEERFPVCCSWRSEYEIRQTESDSDYFERLWESKIPGLKTRPLPEVSLESLREHALPDPQEAVEKARLAEKTGQKGESGKKGWSFTLQKHQAESRTNWWLERRGIVAYVTGGGKTITALQIVQDWFSEYDEGAAIVLVPTNILAKQWRLQLEAITPKLTVLQAGGDDSHPKWRDRLGDFTRPMRVPQRRVVLAVINSAASEDFLEGVREGDHLLVVADEVHRLGANHFRRIMALDAGGRLGLSATPERFNDPEGTDAIFDYFGERLAPEFTIRDALNSDPPRLVQYSYLPQRAFLSPGELSAYKKLSQRVAQLGEEAENGQPEARQKLRRSLIRRAKILKSAEEKTGLAARVIEGHYEEGDRWLAYCDDTDQLENVRASLKTRGIQPLKYHSSMSFSKEATIERFEALGGVLLSINCLDEGVDIPAVTHALILASSVNPRQHLQRRGRVLRTAAGKVEATIFDTLVGPDANRPHIIFDQDLSRAQAFAEDAVNARAVDRQLGALSPYSAPGEAPWADFEEEGQTQNPES